MHCENCGDKLGEGRIAYKYFPKRIGTVETYCKPCLDYVKDMENPKRLPKRIPCKFRPTLIEVI